MCLVGARMRMHEMPRIPCFSACAVMRALCLRAFTRRRSVLVVVVVVVGILFVVKYAGNIQGNTSGIRI